MSKRNETETETGTEAPIAGANTGTDSLKARLQAKIGAGGISPEAVDTLTPYIEAVANASEQLRLLMEIYEEAKGLKRARLEKIKSEVATAVSDWTGATGEIIHAWPATVETAELVREITQLSESEFNKAFRMGKACVDYAHPSE